MWKQCKVDASIVIALIFDELILFFVEYSTSFIFTQQMCCVPFVEPLGSRKFQKLSDHAYSLYHNYFGFAENCFYCKH